MFTCKLFIFQLEGRHPTSFDQTERRNLAFSEIEEDVIICGHVVEMGYFYSLAAVYLLTSYLVFLDDATRSKSLWYPYGYV